MNNSRLVWRSVSLFALGCFMGVTAHAQLFQQGSKLIGSGTVGNSALGVSVSISGDGNTAIVGGPYDNSTQGAAWIYSRSGVFWTQQGSKLLGTGAVGTTDVYQGYAVSVSSDGNTAIVGGFGDSSYHGAAWVYTRSGGVWTQQGGKLVGTGAAGAARQGFAVSLSSDGNTAIVGGYGDSTFRGAAWIFVRSGGVWTQQGGKLVGTGAVGTSVYQGSSVSISSDGNIAIVGGYGDNSNQGAAWMYMRSGGVWAQQGSKLVGAGAVGANVFQGSSVSISSDGNTAIVGGSSDNSNRGAAWVYTQSGGVWTQQGSKLVGAGAGGANVFQGSSVSMSSDGNTAIVGGYGDNSSQGAAWLYARSGGIWSQQGSKLVGAGAGGTTVSQGSSVSISSDGRTAISGGYNDNSGQGASWVFSRLDITVHDLTITEGNGGLKNAVFSASLSFSPLQSVVANYATVDGSAAAGSDYLAASGEISFAPNQTSQSVQVQIIGDYVREGDETFSLRLSNPVNATFADSVGVCTILNDDSLLSAPSIAGITDVPNDQGGYVRIHWTKSILDTGGANPQVTAYGVWRKIPASIPGPVAHPVTAKKTITLQTAIGPKTIVLNDTLSALYDFIESVPAVQGMTYNDVAGTIQDSSASGRHYVTYLVTAHIADPSIFSISARDSGYSVDNLAPLAPTNLTSAISGSGVQLNWNNTGDADLRQYNIYTSTEIGFTPDASTLNTSATTNTYLQAAPQRGYVNYYCVRAVDVHGNIGAPSNYGSISVPAGILSQVSARWNIVSVPLSVPSYGAAVLFPTASTPAYGYTGAYSIEPTLKPGKGYWMKFSKADSILINGLYVNRDTMDVHAGWNLIGSISTTVAVTNVESIPPRLTVSSFFGYINHQYVRIDSIVPGEGYWVKAAGDGKLILATTGALASKNRAQIAESSDTPPPSPEEFVSDVEMPRAYALEQNYPNPFNPSTMIRYALPQSAHVTLSVYNTLGERVALLTDEEESAGYHEAVFQNSGLASGVYFYRLEAAGRVNVKKLLLMK